jgi:hypothetical protein
MTDGDFEHGSRRADGANGAPGRLAAPVRQKTGKRAEPTEPEVPSAKRVRETRRQRSMVLVGSAIVCLVSIALFLLYKTGRQVTTLPKGRAQEQGAASESVVANPAPPPATERSSGPASATIEAPAATRNVPSSEPAAPASSAGSPAAPRPKSSAQAPDIFRKPAF